MVANLLGDGHDYEVAAGICWAEIVLRVVVMY
jgi:hypothetical protein